MLVWHQESDHDSTLVYLKERFENIWKQSDCRLFAGTDDPEGREALARCRTEVAEEFGTRLYQFNPLQETTVAGQITLLAGGFAAARKSPALWQQICTVMTGARSEVAIQTPFVMCDREMLTGLRTVCGTVKKLCLLTNTSENRVNPLGADYANQRSALLQTGAVVYEYGGEKPMHTKTILIDDSICMIGSFNLDNRSAYLDTEIMLVIQCPQLNELLYKQIMDLQKKSLCIAPNGQMHEGEAYKEAWRSPGERIADLLLQKTLRPFEYLL